MAALIDFYAPTMRLPLIIYPVISMVVGASTLWLMESFIGTALSGLTSLLMSAMFYLFPLLFCRNQSPVVETMLPVTALEKTVYFVGMCLIVNPIILWIPYELIQFVLIKTIDFNFAVPMEADIFEIQWDAIKSTFGVSLFLNIAPLVTCMYVVFSRWKNRIGMGIAMSVVTMIVLIVGSLGVGIYMAANEMFEGCVEGSVSYQAGVAIGALAADILRPFMLTLGGISVLYTALMSWLTYRKFKNIQV